MARGSALGNLWGLVSCCAYEGWDRESDIRRLVCCIRRLAVTWRRPANRRPANLAGRLCASLQRPAPKAAMALDQWSKWRSPFKWQWTGRRPGSTV